jgi:aspartyl-tRNA(Asn)/glutamyl-tRNA(Gln) amidotransferase subunit B
MRSAKEAVAYAKALHNLVTWIGICDGNLQEGSFRIDANVSVRPAGQTTFGTRCEIKNLNSFRFLEKAIEVEALRQIRLIEDGGAVTQETRLFDPDREETRAMRSKEDAHDYRYFPDPDLPPLVISQAWIDRIRAEMPELPSALRERLVKHYGLSDYDASMVAMSRDTAQYFSEVLAAQPTDAKLAANWVMGELATNLNRDDLEISQSKVSPSQLAGLIARVSDNTVSNKIGRDIFAALWGGEFESADAVIEARGLKQIQDTGLIAGLVDDVITANPKMAEEFKAGKEKAMNALVGQVMKKSQGKANPQQVSDLIKARLSAGV